MATFPTYAKQMHDVKLARDPAFEETAMESGPSKRAQIRSKVLVSRDLSYAFASLADYNSFISWFNDPIAGAARGAAWVNWTDPNGDVVKLARITLDDETPNKQWDVWVIKLRVQTYE